MSQPWAQAAASRMACQLRAREATPAAFAMDARMPLRQDRENRGNDMVADIMAGRSALARAFATARFVLTSAEPHAMAPSRR